MTGERRKSTELEPSTWTHIISSVRDEEARRHQRPSPSSHLFRLLLLVLLSSNFLRLFQPRHVIEIGVESFCEDVVEALTISMRQCRQVFVLNKVRVFSEGTSWMRGMVGGSAFMEYEIDNCALLLLVRNSLLKIVQAAKYPSELTLQVTAPNLSGVH